MYHDYVDTVRFHLMCERLRLDDSVVTHIRTVARACTRKEKLTKGPILPGGRTALVHPLISIPRALPVLCGPVLRIETGPGAGGPVLPINTGPVLCDPLKCDRVGILVKT